MAKKLNPTQFTKAVRILPIAISVARTLQCINCTHLDPKVYLDSRSNV